MKTIYLVLAFSFLFLTSCTQDDNDNNSENNIVNGTWSIRNVSGGIAGINEDFQEGKMVWGFNRGKLTVTNLETNSFRYGLENGIYSYKIEKIKDIYFLYIDNSEFGGINLLKNGFIIDQNITSNGTGADGFTFKLLE